MEVEVETESALGSGGAISTRAALCAAAYNVLVHLSPLLVRAAPPLPRAEPQIA